MGKAGVGLSHKLGLDTPAISSVCDSNICSVHREVSFESPRCYDTICLSGLLTKCL